MGRMAGFRPHIVEDGTLIETPQTEAIGNYRSRCTSLTRGLPRVTRRLRLMVELIVQIGPEEYLVGGQGIVVTFASRR